MKETLKHKEAFEYYYSLGDKRNLPSVAIQCKCSDRAVANWSKAFNWQERVEQRDIENARRLEEKTDAAVVATKANYRKEIKSSLGVIKAAIGTAIENKKLRSDLSVEDVADLNRLTQAYERLVKLDLLLMGEATAREDIPMEPLTVIIRRKDG